MVNTRLVIIEQVHNADYGRKWALNKCANEAPDLHAEFMKKYFRIDMTTEEYSEAVRKFIEEKKLRVIAEKPFVRLRSDRYVVDVHYTIVW